MPRTGPRTPEGKALVRRNAVKHGLFVADIVVPGVEDPLEWQAFREALIADLAPEGPVETLLAERAAEAAWRRRRVPLAEARLIAAEIDAARRNYEVKAAWHDQPSSVDEAQQLLDVTLSALELLPVLPSLNDADPLDGAACIELLEAAAGHDLPELDELPSLPAPAADVRAWDARLLRAAIDDLALRLATTRDALLETAQAALVEGLGRRQDDVARAPGAAEQARMLQLLPDNTRLTSIDRHESRLDRAFYKALDTLLVFQARRRGEPIPTSRVEFIGLAG